MWSSPVSSEKLAADLGGEVGGHEPRRQLAWIDERAPHPLGGVRIDGFAFDDDGGGSRVLLQVATEAVKTCFPEPVERVHPLPHFVEALGVEVVAALTPVPLLAHEADVRGAPRGAGRRRAG